MERAESRALPVAAVIAVNPRASRLNDPKRRDGILAEVRRSVVARTGLEPGLLVDADRDTMVRRVRAALDDGVGLVVAVGGDGTVRDLAAVLSGRDVPLAIIPVGTANLFAGSLRIPLDPRRAARSLPGARVRRVDLGIARWGTAAGVASEWRVFVVAAGMGFDARVMAATADGAKRRIGRYAYFATAFGLLRHAPGVATRIVADGEALDLQAIEVLVANSGELIPGVLRPAQRIDPADGLLDLIVVEGDGMVAAVRGGIEAIVRRGTRREGSGHARRLRARSVRVDGAAATPIEVDGDLVGAAWLAAECLPRALPVLVPDPAGG